MIKPDIDLDSDLSAIPRKQPTGIARSRLDQLAFARLLRGTFGMRCAAGYMRNLGWSMEAALLNLVSVIAAERAIDNFRLRGLV